MRNNILAKYYRILQSEHEAYLCTPAGERERQERNARVLLKLRESRHN